MSRPEYSITHRHQSGLTLVELLVAMVVSTIVIAAAYGSYSLIKNQYEKVVAVSEMHGNGRTVVDLMSRDIRMTGYHDYCMDTIEEPIRIEVLSGSNTEKITIQFDDGPDLDNDCSQQRSRVDRIRLSYYACNQPGQTCSPGGPYNLYRTKEVWVGSAWSATQGSCAPGGRQAPCFSMSDPALIADNVDDLQFTYDIGAGYIVDISLVSRSGREFGEKASPFPKRGGRHYLDQRTQAKGLGANDRFLRDEFYSTVVLRNLAATDLTQVPVFNAVEAALSFEGGCGGGTPRLFAFNAAGSETIGKLCCGRRTRITCSASAGALASAYNRHLRVLNIAPSQGEVVSLGGSGADAQIQVKAMNAKGGWTTKSYFPQR